MENTEAIKNINGMNAEQRKAFNDVCDVKIYETTDKISSSAVTATATYIDTLNQEDLDNDINPSLRKGVHLNHFPC